LFSIILGTRNEQGHTFYVVGYPRIRPKYHTQLLSYSLGQLKSEPNENQSEIVQCHLDQ